jgi:pyruvate kinase
MRKTKIVCTLGPASNNKDIIRQLARAGMDVARFNFSHDVYEAHLKRLQILRGVAQELKIPIASLMDTKGPEIRIGLFGARKAVLKEGQPFTLTTRDVTGDETIVSVTFAGLPADISQGDKILLDDGLIELRVQSKTDTDILTNVVNGGEISDQKGVNVPGIKLSMPYLSEKDRADIEFAARNDFDFIAASFTRTADDIIAIRSILDKEGGRNIRIIAKIENHQGVENIEDIIRVSDGIMVARGDLGVEIPFEEIPSLQKSLIKRVFNAGKIVITATQMMESMISHPRPTRAETTDVANAIYDGTSAIMLSGETAAGMYPVETVKTMVKIALRTETDIDYRKRFRNIDLSMIPDVTNAISHAACTTAYEVGASAIIAVTQTGNTARMISKFRPSMPIIGCSPDEKVMRQMNMSWGVIPVLVSKSEHSDALFEHTVVRAAEEGLIRDGDMAVITGGVPLGVSGTTNMLKVHLVGNVLLKGTGMGCQEAVAPLCIAMTEEEAKKKCRDGDILVIPYTTNGILNIMKKTSGIITEEPGEDSHAAIVGMALDIPVIVGAYNATHLLKSGMIVKIDAKSGMISSTDQNER